MVLQRYTFGKLRQAVTILTDPEGFITNTASIGTLFINRNLDDRLQLVDSPDGVILSLKNLRAVLGVSEGTSWEDLQTLIEGVWVSETHEKFCTTGAFIVEARLRAAGMELSND